MKKVLYTASILILAATAQAQTWPGWRLKSFATERFENGAYQPADSAQYYYSGNHTGQPTFAWLEDILRSPAYRSALYNIDPALRYDSVRTYRGSTSQNGYADAKLVYTQTLNGNYITARARLSSGNLTAQETYTYNSSNQLTESIAQGYKMQYIYSSGNLPDTVKTLAYNSATQTYTPQQTTYIAYNSSQKPVQMVRMSHTGGEDYTYDYSYNSNGLNDYILVTASGGSMPVPDTFRTYSYTYSPGGDLLTELQQRSNGPGGNMTDWDEHINTYDSKHNRLQDYHFVWWQSGGLYKDSFALWTYTYTPEGLPETFQSQRWDNINKFIDLTDTNDVYTSHRVRLHYEIAWPVNVANPQPQPTTIQLYPNPAGEILTFRISMEDEQPFTASITDMQGRVLMQWNEAPAKTYTRTIPTAALPAGMYVLQIKSGTVQQAKTFSIR